MLLHSLQMVNFKRYQNEMIRFRDGITGIIGNNGSGKSTIVEAILFALYGVQGLGTGSGEFIVRTLAGPKGKCEVRLDFAVNGTDYAVVRSFSKTPSTTRHTAHLFLGDKLLSTGISEVSRELSRIVGMGADDFRHTIYAGQRDLHSLLEKNPGDRRKWFMRVLGIDFIKEESDAFLKAQIQEKERNFSVYRMRLDECDSAALTRERECTAGELEECRGLLASQEREIRSLDTERKQAEEAVQEGLRRKEQFIRFSEQADAKKSTLSVLERDRERLTGHYDVLVKDADTFRTLTGTEEAYAARREHLETLATSKENHDRLSSEDDRLSDQIEHLRAELARKDSELVRMEEDEAACAGLARDVALRESVLSDLEEMKRKEPHYLQLRDERNAFRAKLGEIQDQVREIRNSIGVLERTVASLGDPALREEAVALLLSERDELRDRVSAAREQVRGTDREYARLSRQQEDIRAAGRGGVCPTCHRPLGDDYAAVLADLSHQSAECEARRKHLTEAIAAGEAANEEYEGRIARERQVLRHAQEEADRLRQLQASWQTLFRDAETYLERLAGLDEKMLLLDYDPDRRRACEEDLAAYETVWRRHLALTERLSRKTDLLETAESIRRRLEEICLRRAEVRKQRVDTGFNRAAYQEALEAYNRADETYKTFIALREKVDALPRLAREIEEKKAMAEENRRELSRIESEMARLSFSDASLAALTEQSAVLSGRYDRLHVSMAQNSAKIEALERDLVRLAEEEARRAGYIVECARLENEIVLLKKTRQKLGEYIVYLLHVVRDRIEGEAGRVLGEITDGRYENVLIDDTFNVLVHDMGDQFPSDRFSGGEQDDIAIALRIALSHYLAEMNNVHDSSFLIFDEIFGSQDEERRNHLLQALRSQESRFQQIFLISHISDIQGEFSNTLQVEMGPDDTSRVQEVS
ncbi:MAG: hypothetical protein APR53_03210 [Methanoculleus sp. SDB]|nr:MAG: hypothetical protein APR53_03210 [Methanoculleus sp. SDB]